MYIINPTQKQLDSWFSCNKKMGEYLVYKLGAVLIHKNNKICGIINYNFQEILNEIKRNKF